MDFITGLNPQQQQAVSAGLGPVLVLAGPGSGKTRVLTRRLAFLIGSMGVRPYAILAVTFTNKAAREMEARVASLLGEDTRGLWLGTFHSVCARLLRREASRLPFDANFVIFDTDDQLSLVKRALSEMNLDEKRYRPASMLSAISNAKNELILPDQFPKQTYRDEVVQRLYSRYQELLLASNGLDFDDLLLWTARLLEEQPEVRERYARRFEHILVDEFQDTNQAQYALVKHLASFHRNLFVVGDADQSIYKWRGADYRNVKRFEEDFPDRQLILLEQNYRSTQAILDVAMAVIDRNPHRTRKQLFTDRGQGRKVVLHECYDDRAEAAFVVDTIATLVAQNEAGPGDFAVMYRTNAQSRLLEEAFLHAGLPYRLVGAQRFYGRREVKDSIAFLRLAQNPRDEISLTRVINVPPRDIGNKTFLALRTRAQAEGLSPGELLLSLAAPGAENRYETLLTGRAGKALLKFAKLLDGWREAAEQLPPLALLDRILEEVDYQSYLDVGTEEGNERWENVMELRRLAAEFRVGELPAFLEQVALVSDQDTVQEGGKVPTLLTLHAAKGLEFPVVFIVGLNDGTLPHSRSFDDPEAMQEERRLLYVGITRAMDRLYLLQSQNRSAYGYPEPADPSRFLDDIPPELLEQSAPVRSRRSYTPVTSRPDRWESTTLAPGAPPSRPKPPTTIRFPAGKRVTHPTWGEGMVLNSRIQDDDEIVDVFFEQVGLKRVAASLARLELKS